MFGRAMIQVPKDFQDYDDDDPNIDKRKSRMKYWASLKNLRKEWKEEAGDVSDHLLFLKWVEKKYGFKPTQTIDGHITDDYQVVDEKKFLVYILKYG